MDFARYDNLRGMTFHVNSAHFDALERVRMCLLWLSAEGVEVVRIQTREGRALVEAARPPRTNVPFEENEHGGRRYQRADLHGCQVIWPSP